MGGEGRRRLWKQSGRQVQRLFFLFKVIGFGGVTLKEASVDDFFIFVNNYTNIDSNILGGQRFLVEGAPRAPCSSAPASGPPYSSLG